jgi:hypothetical protein
VFSYWTDFYAEFNTEQYYKEGDMPGQPYPYRMVFTNTVELENTSNTWKNMTWNPQPPLPSDLCFWHVETQTDNVSKLNVDDSPSTAQQFGVMSIPTLILFSAGEERGRVIGARGKEDIVRTLLGDLAA